MLYNEGPWGIMPALKTQPVFLRIPFGKESRWRGCRLVATKPPRRANQEPAGKQTIKAAVNSLFQRL